MRRSVERKMQISLRSLFGFAFSVPAYTLLFLWPALLSIMICADYGPLPNAPSQNHVNRLYYDFMIATFSAEAVWSFLAILCVLSSALFSLYLSADIRPACLGDWQPILLHLFFILSFGILNLITLALLSLQGWN